MRSGRCRRLSGFADYDGAVLQSIAFVFARIEHLLHGPNTLLVGFEITAPGNIVGYWQQLQIVADDQAVLGTSPLFQRTDHSDDSRGRELPLLIATYNRQTIVEFPLRNLPTSIVELPLMPLGKMGTVRVLAQTRGPQPICLPVEAAQETKQTIPDVVRIHVQREVEDTRIVVVLDGMPADADGDL